MTAGERGGLRYSVTSRVAASAMVRMRKNGKREGEWWYGRGLTEQCVPVRTYMAAMAAAEEQHPCGAGWLNGEEVPE